MEAAALAYSEGQTATIITSTTTVADVDNTTLTGASVWISTAYVNTEDVLAFTNTPNITGTWNATTGILTLTGTTTLANYQSAIRSITYQNTNNNNPSTTTRTVSFQVNDGAALSNIATRNINVTPVNDAPVLASMEAAALAYSEGQAATIITGLTTVTDVDNTNLTGATISISAGYLNTEDVLAFTNTPNITGTWTAATGILTLTGTTTVANYQSAIQSITYQNTNNNNPSTTTRTVSFQVNDGVALSNIVVRNINVTPVNDAPVLANMEAAALAYSEGQAATIITTATTVADVDNTTLTGASVWISAAYVNTEDVLAFTNTPNITGTWNATTGILTLTGTTTVANYQSSIQSITYQNTNNNNPSTTTRTVSFQVNDGVALSNIVVRNINVTPVNDAPVLANMEAAALAYSEGQAATVITGLTTVTDVDNTTLTGATISISAGYLNTEDVLAFTNTPNITGTWTAATGILTLTGTTTVANYQSAIQSITYQNTNNSTPSTTTRTVSFQVNDGAALSNIVTRNINVTPVNDAPLLANMEAAALAYSEGQAATVITGLTTVADVDNTTLTGAIVWISTAYVNTEDVLAFTNAFGITGSWNATTGTLTLTGTTTLANYQSAIRSVTYQNTNNNNPSAAVRTVSFQVNDGAALSNIVARNINVTPVNDASVLANMEAAALAYSEGQAATIITTATTVADVDNTTLTGASVWISAAYVNTEDVLAFTNAFSITGSWNATTGTLTLTGTTTLANYQSAIQSITYQNTNNNNPSTTTRTVSFQVNDGAALSNIVVRNINVTPVNDAPVLANMEAAALAYSEGQAAAVITGLTTVTDVDNTTLTGATISISSGYLNTEDVLAFTNTPNITGTWNATTGILTLTGTTTVANYQSAIQSITYQNTNNNNPSAAVRTVSFQVNDGAALSNVVVRNINITPVNDAPVLANMEAAALAYSEGQAATVITGLTTVTDVDNTTLTGASVWISAAYVNTEDVLAFTNTPNITGTWNATTGILTLTGTTTLANYQSAIRSVTYQNTNNNNPSAVRTVSFQVNDGAALSNIVVRNINVTPVNDAPVLANMEAAALAYSEGQAATVITGLTTVTDVDNTTLTGATISISAGYLNTEDVLAFTNTPNITGTWTAATGILTLTGTTTVANYQSAIQSITYQNTNNSTPSTTTRTVSFQVNDGVALSNIVVRNINVTPVNDAPVLANMEAAALAYSEGQAATVITTATTVADVDNTTLTGASVWISAAYVNTEDVLAFINTPNITGTWNATTGILTLTGTTTLANYQNAIQSITYQNTNNNNPSTTTRTVSFQVNDGAALSNIVARNINVTPVNDAPVLANTEAAALAYSEGQAAAVITGLTTVADVDNTTLTGASVWISAGYLNTEDVLAFTNAFSITGSWNATTGTLTLSGTTTLANYQSAIRSVTYQNTNNNNPSAAVRTVSFQVNDGAALSNIVVRNINVTPVNDAPVLANMEAAALAYSEGQAAAVITGLTTVTDVDNTTLTGASVWISAGYLNTEDVLAFTNAFSITGSWSATTAILTLTGATTLANYQSAIRSITYQNTNNNNPSTTTRTVSFQVNDGAALSNIVVRNINVTPVNDAPVLANIEAAALAYSEGQTATIITSTTTVADVDNTTLTGASVWISTA